jgi:hypothetical protein
MLTLCAWLATAQIDVTGRYEHEGPITASLEVVREENRYVVRLEGGVPSGQGAATPADCLIEARGTLKGTSLEARFGGVETDTFSYRATQAEREGRTVAIVFETDGAEVVRADVFGYCGLGADFAGRYQKVAPSPQ